MKLHVMFLCLFILFMAACTAPVKNEKSTDTLSTAVVSKPDSSVQEPIQDANAEESEDAEEGEEASSGPLPYPGAQELWKYTFYGFTPDLVNTAFSTTGPDDYNWVGYEFYVVNVNKNDFTGKPYRERFEDEIPDDVNKTIAARLAQYKLPVKTGFTKYNLDPTKEQSAVTIKGHTYLLKLLQTDVGEKKIFELQLIDPSTYKTWVLQKDNKLPASRGSVKRYKLKDAYVQDTKLAVMLEMDMESYEFESVWKYPTKYMMVTGTTEAKPNVLN
jgi:hypothetical protein